MISIGAALNLFWVMTTLLVGVCLYQRSSALSGAAYRKVCALLLAAVALFPVFSSTDDLVRFAFLGTAVHTGRTAGSPSDDDSAGKTNTDTQLARLLDSLDAVQITPFFTFAATFVPSEIAQAPAAVAAHTSLLPHDGRAPPVSA